MAARPRAARHGGERRAIPEEVAPYRFGPAVSPHYAAELSGASIDAEALLRAARDAGRAPMPWSSRGSAA